MSFDRPSRPPLRVTLWTRLYFIWATVWAIVMTIPLATGMLLHSLVRPSPATFRFWLTSWGRMVLAGAGFRLRTEVREFIPANQPVVFVANHQNMLDIITCAAGIPHRYGFIAKASLRRMPFIGAVLESSSSVFVDRTTARLAAESIREAAEVIRNGTSVLVYVEGERSYGADLVPFLRGAFLLAVQAGVPLVPVVQLDNFEVIDERRRVARPGPVHLIVTTPIPTADCSRADIPVLMERVREMMESELGLYHAGEDSAGTGEGVSSAPTPDPIHDRHPR